MVRVFFCLIGALLLVACASENSSHEAPETPQAEAQTERSTPNTSSQAPAESPESSFSAPNSGNARGPVQVNLNDQSYYMPNFNQTNTQLTVSNDAASVRLCEFGSDRVLIIGFRNMNPSDPFGAYNLMDGKKTDQPIAVVNAMNFQSHAAKHVVMKEGLVTLEALDKELGIFTVSFDGVAYATSDKTKHNPMEFSGSVDVVVPNIRTVQK